MAKFWDSWQLWCKMVFILATLITLTLIFGYIKLRFDKYKLKKAAELAERQREQRELYGQQDSELLRKHEIPFGIRCIEAGIQVPGVWIAKSTLSDELRTKLGSNAQGEFIVPPGTLVGKVGNKLHASISDSTELEMPPPLRIDDTGRSSNGGDRRNQAFCRFDRAGSADFLPGTSASNSNTVLAGDSALGYLSRTPVHRNSVTLSALEGGPIDTSLSRLLRGTQHKLATSQSSSSIGIYGFNNGYLNAGHYIPTQLQTLSSSLTAENRPESIRNPVDLLPFTENKKGDLSSLYYHRMSHAAETGQLLPRSRRSGVSSEYSPSTAPSGTSQHPEYPAASDYSNRHRSLPTSGLLSTASVPVAFKEFAKSHPVPGKETQLKRFVMPGSRPKPLANEEPHRSESTSPTHLADRAHSGSGSNVYQHRNSATRIVNSGFAVLPAGTFDTAQVRGRIDWDADLEAGEEKPSRKLKKKPKSESRFKEEVE